MRIVRAREEDLERIVELNRLFHLNLKGFIWDTPSFVEDKIDEGNYYVATSDRIVISGAMCLDFWREYARIDTIAVDKSEQGRGLGKKLVGFAKEKSIKFGKKGIFVNSFCKYGVGGFYESCGFVKLSLQGFMGGQKYNTFFMDLS